MKKAIAADRDVDVACGELAALWNLLQTSDKPDIRSLCSEVLMDRIARLHLGRAEPFCVTRAEREGFLEGNYILKYSG